MVLRPCWMHLQLSLFWSWGGPAPTLTPRCGRLGLCSSLRGRTQSCVSSETRQRTARWWWPPARLPESFLPVHVELHVQPNAPALCGPPLGVHLPGPGSPHVSNVRPGRNPARARTTLRAPWAACWTVPTNSRFKRLVPFHDRLLFSLSSVTCYLPHASQPIRIHRGREEGVTKG